MKRLCIMVDVSDERSDCLLQATAETAAVMAAGTLRCAYIEHRAKPASLADFLLRLLGFRSYAITELHPTHTNKAGLEPAKEPA